jgi:K+-sensing histidine kinase KdpD
LTSILLLIDSIQTDKKEWQDFTEDLNYLHLEIKKISLLVKNIFSAEKYDIKSIELYKERVEMSTFLQEELLPIQRTMKSVLFIEIAKNIWYLWIDRIQFKQVINNLIGNAQKFAKGDNPHILFRAYKENDCIIIEIEDNGKWIHGINIENIFDKYATWEWHSSGIWMWLYLCKKIIELHDGKIEANKSFFLGGAKFSIYISTKSK